MWNSITWFIHDVLTSCNTKQCSQPSKLRGTIYFDFDSSWKELCFKIYREKVFISLHSSLSLMNNFMAPSMFDYCKSIKPYNFSWSDCLKRICYLSNAGQWNVRKVCHYEIWGKFALLLKRFGLFLVLEFCVWRYTDAP